MAKNGAFQNPFSAEQKPPKDEGLPKAADDRDEYVEPTGDDIPLGSAREVLDWVDGDQTRAQRALDAEQNRVRPRTGLSADLQELIDG